MDDDENYEAWLDQLEQDERRQLEQREHQEQLHGICIDQG